MPTENAPADERDGGPAGGDDGRDGSGGWNHPEYRLPYVVTGLLAAAAGYVTVGVWGILGGFLVAQVVWMVLDRTT